LRRLTLSLVAFVALPGCLLLPSGPFKPVADCNDPVAADLAGRWTLRGSGSRTGCTDSRYAGRFTFETPQALEVVSDASSTATVAKLRLANPIPGFTLSAQLSGSCFSAQTNETLPEDSVDFAFTADVGSGATLLQGKFEGNGPETCVSEGTFDLSIEP